MTEEISPTSPEPITISLFVQELAGRLGETEPEPIALLAQIVEFLGEDKANELCQQALDKQDAGGMFIKKLDRRRTTGGIFFLRARQLIKGKAWNKLNPRPKIRKKKPEKDQTSGDKVAKPGSKKIKAGPPFTEEELTKLYAEATSWTPGPANSTKLTIMGRPGKVTIAGGLAKPDNFGYAAFTLEMSKIPALPKGLPVPQTNTKYLVLIGSKQWRKAEGELKQSELNRLLIETYPTINSKVVAGIVAAGNNAVINQVTAKEGKELIRPEPGVASATKVLITGRPGPVKAVRDMRFFLMEASKVPPLPTGLPPIGPGTKYLVCVTSKQWDKVKSALDQDDQDKLIVEGHPSFDARFAGVIVSATNVTTMFQQKTKRENQPDPKV